MAEQYVAPGHRLPDADWAKVVARAAEVAAQVKAEAQGGAAAGGIIVDMTPAGLRSKKYFGVSGIPTQLLVLHSGECPLRAGFAVSLSEWSSATVHPGLPQASWQRFIDPIHRVRLIPDELGAWHASEANVLSIGWEQAGYARFTRAEWLTPDGLAQMDLLAIDMAEVAIRDGIPPRWLTYDEVRAVLDGGNRTIKGFCFHRQIDPDTRTDPGNGYPADLLMERIKAYMGGGQIPTPTPTTPEEQDDDMLHLTAPGDGKVWLSNGVQKWHVPDPSYLIHIRTLAGYGALKVYADGKEILTAPALGADMGALQVDANATVELRPEDLETIVAGLRASLSPALLDDLAQRLTS